MLTIEELQALLEESEAKRQESETKLQALERTKIGLLSDLQKKKGVDRLVKAAGIDLSSEDAEDRIAELLAARAASSADGTPAGTPPASASGEPSAPGTTSSAADEVLRATLTSMQKQMDQLNTKLQQTEQEKQQERKARLDGFKRSVVMQELEKAGCKRPAHVYALQGSQFRLLDDDETVVYGSEENPVNVSDAISNLERDDEYSIYFPGVVASGSGLPTSRSSTPVNENPFMRGPSGSGNATKATEIIMRDRALAQRLVQQARARGNLDPILASVIGY